MDLIKSIIRFLSINPSFIFWLMYTIYIFPLSLFFRILTVIRCYSIFVFVFIYVNNLIFLSFLFFQWCIYLPSSSFSFGDLSPCFKKIINCIFFTSYISPHIIIIFRWKRIFFLKISFKMSLVFFSSLFCIYNITRGQKSVP